MHNLWRKYTPDSHFLLVWDLAQLYTSIVFLGEQRKSLADHLFLWLLCTRSRFPWRQVMYPAREGDRDRNKDKAKEAKRERGDRQSTIAIQKKRERHIRDPSNLVTKGGVRTPCSNLGTSFGPRLWWIHHLWYSWDSTSGVHYQC